MTRMILSLFRHVSGKCRQPTQALANRLKSQPIEWRPTGNPHLPYDAQCSNQTITLRMNNFPDEPLYTALDNKGRPLLDVDGFLPNWEKSDAPKSSPSAMSLTF